MSLLHRLKRIVFSSGAVALVQEKPLKERIKQPLKSKKTARRFLRRKEVAFVKHDLKIDLCPPSMIRRRKECISVLCSD